MLHTHIRHNANQVVKESATGSTTSNKIRLNLTIEVERVQFDPDTCVLRLSGKNREETEHVKVGGWTARCSWSQKAVAQVM